MSLTVYDNRCQCLRSIGRASVRAADAVFVRRQCSYVTTCRCIWQCSDDFIIMRLTRWTDYYIVVVIPCYRILSTRRYIVSGAIQSGVLTSQHNYILRSFRWTSLYT